MKHAILPTVALSAAALLSLVSFHQIGSAQSAAAKPYPSDVNVNSGFRLPLPQRAGLDPLGQKMYDDIVGPDSKAIAGLRGPLGIRLYNPRVAELSNSLSRYLRFEAGLPPALRELVILTTARELNNQFEWTAHEPVALKEGLRPEIIDAIKYRKPLTGLPAKDAVVIQMSRQIFSAKKLDSETYAQALKLFGPRDLLNLVSLMGTYSSTAVLITAFDMQLRPDQKGLLPLP